ncbi:ATPase [Paenibacillus alvei]
MSKYFWVPFTAGFATVVLLYIVGTITEIDILMFRVSLSYTEISFFPIIVGILVGLISKQIIRYKSKVTTL